MSLFETRWSGWDAENRRHETYWIDGVEVDYETYADAIENNKGRYTAPHFHGQYRRGRGRMDAWLPGHQEYTGALFVGKEAAS